jgi:hypothetical protein
MIFWDVNVQDTHILSRMFVATVRGHTLGIAGTAKGRLRQEPVMRARSEAMLVGSMSARC